MRRYPFVIGGTAAALAGILSFHTSSGSGLVALPATSPSGSQKTTGASSQSSPGSPTSGAPSTTQPPSSSSTAAPTTAPPTTAAPATTSATGAAVRYGYGVISVRVTVNSGKIVAATVATLQTAESYSQQLASEAVPILRREVLSAQSANIQAVSGATYTSQAYAASVQAALDALHA